jgi:hypothetical protein
MSRHHIGRLDLAVIVLAFALAGCGDAGDSNDTRNGTDSAPAASTGEQATESTASSPPPSGAIDPCALLDGEQVTSVLPGHDGGSIIQQGGSLLQGVDAFQCSWMAIAGDDVRLLTLILNVASTDALFEQIRPSGFAREDDAPVTLGDGGWSGGEPDRWKVTVMKGRTLIDLELSVPAADRQSARLVELAGSIAEEL